MGILVKQAIIMSKNIWRESNIFVQPLFPYQIGVKCFKTLQSNFRHTLMLGITGLAKDEKYLMKYSCKTLRGVLLAQQKALLYAIYLDQK